MNEIDILIKILKQLSQVDTSQSETSKNDDIQNILSLGPESWSKGGPFVQYLGDVLTVRSMSSLRSKLISSVSTDELKKAIKVMPMLKRVEGYKELLPPNMVETLDGEVLEIPE